MKSQITAVALFLATFNVLKGETEYVFSNAVKSSYFTTGGMRLSEVPVHQLFVSATFDNNFGVYLWTNTELGSGVGTTEVDLGVTYGFPSFELGMFTVTTSLEYSVWLYPVPKLGSQPDHALVGAVAFASKHFDVLFQAKHTLTSGQGTEYGMILSRAVPLTDRLSITPSVGVSYHDNFFYLSGWGAVQGGVTGSYKLGADWSFDASVIFQEDLGGNFEDQVFWGVALKRVW